MPRTTKSLTISLPYTEHRQLEQMQKREHRSRSELVRQALQAYFAMSMPAVDASPSELAAIRRGRDEIARGEYVTLEQLHENLARPHHKTGRKTTRQIARS